MLPTRRAEFLHCGNDACPGVPRCRNEALWTAAASRGGSRPRWTGVGRTRDPACGAGDAGGRGVARPSPRCPAAPVAGALRRAQRPLARAPPGRLCDVHRTAAVLDSALGRDADSAREAVPSPLSALRRGGRGRRGPARPGMDRRTAAVLGVLPAVEAVIAMIATG